MRNRAKCKRCETVIESTHRNDYVTCPCGEISVDGGQDYFRCRAADFSNFIRVDDEGNEIIVRYKESIQEPLETPKPTYDELMKMLAEMINKIKDLPPVALTTSINHYDYLSLIMLMYSIFDTLQTKKES